MNFEKIERGGHVLYMCLDSLPDPSVASAIGALALADLAARAGMRYNLGSNRRISLFVDEISNVINQPLIEILNKGAEGGIYTTCAMQTLADLAKRLGSEDAARMALGNLNNLIALRSKDRPTQDFIVETFGKTGIHTMRVGLNRAPMRTWATSRRPHRPRSPRAWRRRVPADIARQAAEPAVLRLGLGRPPHQGALPDPRPGLRPAQAQGAPRHDPLRLHRGDGGDPLHRAVHPFGRSGPDVLGGPAQRARAQRARVGRVRRDAHHVAHARHAAGFHAAERGPAPTQHAGPQSSVDAAVAAQMSQMNARLFGNPYFRPSIRCFVLVCYRVSAAVELLPLLLVFCFVVLVDGCMLRLVRAKEFIAHSAELFGGSVLVAIALGTAVAVAFFLPFQVHPMYVMLCLLAMLFVLSRAVANYHAIR